jgi:hypothetical protein
MASRVERTVLFCDGCHADLSFDVRYDDGAAALREFVVSCGCGRAYWLKKDAKTVKGGSDARGSGRGADAPRAGGDDRSGE